MKIYLIICIVALQVFQSSSSPNLFQQLAGGDIQTVNNPFIFVPNPQSQLSPWSFYNPYKSITKHAKEVASALEKVISDTSKKTSGSNAGSAASASIASGTVQYADPNDAHQQSKSYTCSETCTDGSCKRVCRLCNNGVCKTTEE